MLGASVQAAEAAGSPPPLPAAVDPAKPDAEARGDTHDTVTHQLANEPGVVSGQKFTGDEAAAIVDKCKSSKISLETFPL